MHARRVAAEVPAAAAVDVEAFDGDAVGADAHDAAGPEPTRRGRPRPTRRSGRSMHEVAAVLAGTDLDRGTRPPRRRSAPAAATRPPPPDGPRARRAHRRHALGASRQRPERNERDGQQGASRVTGVSGEALSAVRRQPARRLAGRDGLATPLPARQPERGEQAQRGRGQGVRPERRVRVHLEVRELLVAEERRRERRHLHGGPRVEVVAVLVHLVAERPEREQRRSTRRAPARRPGAPSCRAPRRAGRAAPSTPIDERQPLELGEVLDREVPHPDVVVEDVDLLDVLAAVAAHELVAVDVAAAGRPGTAARTSSGPERGEERRRASRRAPSTSRSLGPRSSGASRNRLTFSIDWRIVGRSRRMEPPVPVRAASSGGCDAARRAGVIPLRRAAGSPSRRASRPPGASIT